MEEIAPCSIEAHQTQVSVKIEVVNHQFQMSLIARDSPSMKYLGRLSISDGKLEGVSRFPLSQFRVADSIYMALKKLPHSHPGVYDALTWESEEKWQRATSALDAARTHPLVLQSLVQPLPAFPFVAAL